ncbi:MAG: AMP-binding protein, partial [Rhodopila sp.]
MTNTVFQILASNNQLRAIGAPGGDWLSGMGLHQLAVEVGATLNRVGIGRGDRIASVLPNGPEMAACFVAVASSSTAAPLNPAYKSSEFEFFLSDLKPAALIVADGDVGPARVVAERLSIPVIRLIRTGARAGLFRLDTSNLSPMPSARPGPAEAEDVALLLHTSGTTARPKLVPLTNRNLAASALNIGTSLALSPADTCLNIMPLFHIHGLV